MEKINIIKQVHLYAPQSPKKAFYDLFLAFNSDKYIVRKKSGYGDKLLDSREWKFSSLSDAEKMFNLRIKQKTKPDRKSPRQYVDLSALHI